MYICGCTSGGLKTKVKNLTERPIDLQIRVGSILKKVYTVKPGRGKTLDCSNIYNVYAPRGHSAFYYDETCQPYVWIHNSNEFSRMVKQQYISLEDLRDHSEIKIYRDPKKGTFAVYKKPRSEIC
ncbi:hypothetical protein SUGI_0142940 [Cryptomeria japonica]|nr:hypothetical protein SUGI_0142940 [Cryptomeria japonica]